MTTDLLRPSRDGDQFHYVWAARQALRLLEPGTRLDSIYVEGVSPSDGATGKSLEVIDLAEYWGASDPASADRVVYRQLKHSTLQTSTEWTASFLKGTLAGFAERFSKILKKDPSLGDRIFFEVVSNRPASPGVHAAISDLASGRPPSAVSRSAVRYIRRELAAVLTSPQIAQFCRQLRIDDTAPGLLRLRPLFEQDLNALLPGAPADYALRLKEMVGGRATSQHGGNPRVDKVAVLAAIGVSEEALLPAPSLLQTPATVVPTAHLATVVDQLRHPDTRPILIHAPGGVGKSVLAHSIGASLPAGSVTLVYDCFGNGSYRLPSSWRHEPKRALVQIVNELAAQGLCDPLIPSDTAGYDDYFRVFMKRVANAAQVVATRGPDTLLVLVIDAADNAVLVADENGTRAFAPGLLREQMPPNTRLITLCRTERLHLLTPPAGYRAIALSGFTQDESAALLRASFPDADDRDAAEFHARTGGNPRVQITALGSAASLTEVLSRLGQVGEADRDVFGAVMRELVEQLKDRHHQSAEIDQICVGLAALRPMIPVRVLAQLAQVDVALVESFVADLGHPLLIDAGAVQFRDEPTETWFRERFRPVGEGLDDLLGRLRPMAAEDPYAAASIPALLWEARRVDDLIRLALSDDDLPFGAVEGEQPRNLQRTEIDQERAQFALKAALREGLEFEAGRLAVKVGALAAGRTRRLELIRQHTDLAADFLDPHIVEQLVAARSLSGSWPNSNLPAEGALLSGAAGRIHQARNRLRSAQTWMKAWTQGAREQGERSEVGHSDIALVAWGLLNTDGAKACAGYLRRWTPETVAFDAGLIVSRRLIDAGRIAELDLLGSVEGPRYLAIAVAHACAEAGQQLGVPAVRRVLDVLRSETSRLPLSDRATHDVTEAGVADGGVAAVTWAVGSGLRYDLVDKSTAAEILGRYLPEDLGYRTGDRYERGTLELLVGFALLARVRGQAFDPGAIAGKEVREAKSRPAYASSSSRARAYDANVTPLAGWVDLWVDVLLGNDAELEERYDQMESIFDKSFSYDPPHFLLNSVCRTAIRVLAVATGEVRCNRFVEFCSAQFATLARATLTQVVRVSAGHPYLHGVSVEIATALRTSMDETRAEASYIIDGLIMLARATYRLGDAEARAHFEQAVAVADRVGDDAHARWTMLLQMADAASAAGRDQPERAYRLAQVAENLEPYLGDGVDLAESLQSAGKLSANTAIAIGSRWRDRRIVTVTEMARALVAGKEALLRPTPLVATALLPLGDHWQSIDIITHAMRQHPEQAGTVVRVLGEFARAVKHTAESYRQLDDIAAETQIPLDGTCFAPDARAVAEPPTSFVSSRWLGGSDTSEIAKHQDSSHTAFDLTSPVGWADALAIAKDHQQHPDIRLEDVYDQAAKTPSPQKAQMVEAFSQCPHTSTWDVERLLDIVGTPEQLSFGLRAEIRKLARAAIVRFCREVVLKRWDPIDFTRLAAAAGEPSADYVGQALRTTGTTAPRFNAEEAFALAGRLASRVTSEEAGVLLDEGLRLFAEVADADAGDGGFESLPPAPKSTPHAVAGALWATLADVDDANRWRAAHGVRLLLALGCRDVTDLLLDFAVGRESPAPYFDARLPFYERHAQQWLLLALARSAQDPDAQAATAQFEPLLRHVLFEADPHLVMQHSARATLIALARQGFISMSEAEATAVRHIGSPIAVIETTSWRTGRRVVHRLADIPTLLRDSANPGAPSVGSSNDVGDPEPPTGTGRRDPRFRFFMDFADHWCSDLGDAFDISTGSIERLVEEILLDRWHTPCRGEYSDDPRHQLKLYRRDKYTSKSEYPYSDDLDFYLSVHALFELAGRLIAALPVIRRPGQHDSEWDDFLRRHVPTRKDGRWLADRRDAAPPMQVREPGDGLADGGSREQSNQQWKQSLNVADCVARLSPRPGWVIVWEDSWSATYTRTEVVDISSALVSTKTGPALLRALESAPDAHAFRLPATNDREFEFDAADFQMAGWIQGPGRRSGIDERDPHSGTVRYPPPRPTAKIAAALAATPDLDLRTWSIDGTAAVQSLVWNDTERNSSRERGSIGERLTIRTTDLTELLRRTGRSLIVEVRITRRIEASRAHPVPVGRPDDDDTTTGICTKYFLFDEHGARHEL